MVNLDIMELQIFHPRGIAKAAKSAFLQAKLASKYSIFKFDPQLDQSMWDLINPHTLKIGCHYHQKS